MQVRQTPYFGITLTIRQFHSRGTAKQYNGMDRLRRTDSIDRVLLVSHVCLRLGTEGAEMFHAHREYLMLGRENLRGGSVG